MCEIYSAITTPERKKYYTNKIESTKLPKQKNDLKYQTTLTEHYKYFRGIFRTLSNI